jgi:rubredoxin
VNASALSLWLTRTLTGVSGDAPTLRRLREVLITQCEGEPEWIDEPLPLSPVPMLLWCPSCRMRHIDVGLFAEHPHHTHACQGCGMVWRPALGPTVGVKYLPGFKDET